ncbi:hypothetical protein HanRHA438_Chr09g0388621 [Helianthus annuus]|nr:hypothetical protein HanHA300_Chr09g0309551 [Helianthus annuus]KAJ0533266.1 hypothetical protein HanIR_Chr09g0406431 [Helianthus annuus]KAJ0541586.1 hypothetical protein HanHA89_Chr09g0330161 [Helianthus annuus]KAJ0706660.1 hypothetical protein HanLR1_Chr09g0309591 [Helianthus annuus]KAJ0887248.1 hypothetical protein HanRHA438_Chr09g0388621 [Helianthus annuus]
MSVLVFRVFYETPNYPLTNHHPCSNPCYFNPHYNPQPFSR